MLLCNHLPGRPQFQTQQHHLQAAIHWHWQTLQLISNPPPATYKILVLSIFTRHLQDPPAANLPDLCNAMEEEDAHDQRTHNKNAGASDSDDEDNLCVGEAATERQEHFESNLSAA